MTHAQEAFSVAFEPTSCTLCGHEEARTLYPRRLSAEDLDAFAFSARRSRPATHYAIGKCTSCGLVRSLERVPESLALKLYSDSEYLYSDIALEVATTYLELFNEVNRYMKLESNASILEVGCGDGRFLELLYKDGFTNLVGIDPSRKATAALPENLRNNIMRKPFDAHAFTPSRFDFITSFHVMDHFYNPRQFLTDTMQLLKPGGYSLTVCHDVASWSARLLGSKSPIFDIEHMYLFDESTLGALYQSSGFEVVRHGQLANRYPLSYWLRLLPKGKPVSQLLPGWLQKWQIRLKAGNMYMLARKPL